MKQLFRRNLFFVLLVIIMYLGFTAISYGQALVYIEFVQTDPLAVGEQMNVNVQIADGQDVSGYELAVGFDPTALRYLKSANANYLPANAFVIPPIVSNETVHIVATSPAGAATEAEGTLATLTFEVVAIKGSTIKLMDVILSDGEGMPLAVATKNGRIVTIQLPLIGDVNEDGKVNILDLTLVASNLTADAPTNPRVDVNKDGAVNILDLVLVAQHLDAVRDDEVEPEVRVVPGNPEEVAIAFPEEPVVASRPPIDFDAEKKAIQAVYADFYNAFNDFDIKAVQETFDTASIQFGTIFAGNEPVPVAIGWKNVKTNILGLWQGIGIKGSKWGQNSTLSKVWIRYKGSSLEASALGLNCFKGAFPGETHLYLVKNKDEWLIQQIDSVTQNNLGIFGLDNTAKPRIEKFFARSSTDKEDLAP